MRLTFSQRNRARCESPRGFHHSLDSWSLSDWLVALCGEAGEACNIAKKLNRVRDNIPGNDHLTESPIQLRQALAKEFADIYIYLDLAVQACGFCLEEIVE
jgi:NTP pyrophosphatase (non-canonical NTP hydrolase)